ncbi:hypothetical protein 4 [Kumasi rhabdovirus]|uniref:Uncharacterized protein n=1 Tax=Kumasi rhabdovirus TaxID=1537975 RepID=A0A0C4MHH2_9RHAB|nr:hypothetical protein 4 [Kumasi rhabdovirus]AIL31435.1 hypothetical protein 4 [Kumasi rhabdovirus]
MRAGPSGALLVSPVQHLQRNRCQSPRSKNQRTRRSWSFWLVWTPRSEFPERRVVLSS